MLNVSNAFLDSIREKYRRIHYKVMIGSVELTGEEIKSIETEYSAGNSDCVGIGSTIASKLKLSVFRTGNTPDNITLQKIMPYVGIEVNGIIDWVKLGSFYPVPSQVEKTDLLFTVECFDRMTDFDGYTYSSALSYPTTVGAVLDEMQSKLGVRFLIRSELRSVTVPCKLAETVRGVFSAIGVITGTSCMIDRDENVCFKSYTETNFTLDAENYSMFAMSSEESCSITGLKCVVRSSNNDSKTAEVETVELVSGNSTGVVIELTGAYLTSQEQLDSVFNKCLPVTYQPYVLALQGMPHIEAGDIIMLTDNHGVARSLHVVTHRLYMDGGGLKSEFSASMPDTTNGTVGEGGGSGTFINEGLLAKVNRLLLDSAEVRKLIADRVQINQANIDKAWITDLFVKGGLLANDGNFETGAFTKYLTGVKIIGDLIEAGTLKTDRLIIKGTDGKYYALNTDFTGMPNVEPVEEETIHGSILVKESITAAQIAAGAITAEKIDIINLFAQDIKASGTIKGATIEGHIDSTTGSVGPFSIEPIWGLNSSYFHDSDAVQYNMNLYGRLLHYDLTGDGDYAYRILQVNYKSGDPDDGWRTETDMIIGAVEDGGDGFSTLIYNSRGGRILLNKGVELRGIETRPHYNGSPLALLSDVGSGGDGTGGDGTGGGVSAGLPYGVCETAAATAAKTVTVSGGNFTLKEGAAVIVRFANANSASSPTLNVNGTGAKPIRRYGSTNVSTGTTTTGWIAGAVQLFIYNGSAWVRDYWSNTTYSNASLGQGYATCDTVEATVAKVGTLSSYSLTTGGVVAVKFTNAVPASATLNINSKGAKPIYYNGAAITAGIIKAGDIATFIYNGSYYHLLSIDRWDDDIRALKKEIVDLKLSVGDGGDNAQKWIGQTPYEMKEEASLLSLIGDGTYSFWAMSPTVADMENASEPRCTNCELVDKGKYYELRATGGTAWYNAYMDTVLSGLTIGEKYAIRVDALGRTYNGDSSYEARTFGHHIICAGTSYSTANVIGTLNTNVSELQQGTPAYNIDAYKVEFTATTESVVLRSYPGNSSAWNKMGGYNGVVAEFNSFYINRVGSNKHTDIVDLSGTFKDMRTLSDIPAGTIVTTDPVCDVYAAIVREEEEIGAYKPLNEKTVVCFGDSLFGMYRGSDSAPAFIAESTGATVHNVGFGGCRMSVHPSTGFAAFSMWALAKAIVDGDWSTQDAQASSGSAYFPDQLGLLKSIDFSTVDYIVIHYGTNDFAAGSAIQLDNPNDHDDYNTLCGALRYSIEKLHGKYPKLKIFVSLPVFRFWTENNVTTYSDTYLKHGKTLPEFVEALRSTAAEYNLPVIDGYYGLGINKANASAFLSDGTHHNADGRQRFGEYIGASLIAQQTIAQSGTDGYSKKEIDTMFGSYVDDVALLVGGDA